MVICSLCEGFGKRYETIVEYTATRTCKACDGVGRVPSSANAGWRPFEVSLETVEAGREYNSCNLHTDCEEADAKARETGSIGRYGQVGMAYHCWSEDCEECFGC